MFEKYSKEQLKRINNFIEQMTNNNPWMKEIFDVFTAYDTLKEIYPHFQEITNILDEHFS